MERLHWHGRTPDDARCHPHVDGHDHGRQRHAAARSRHFLPTTSGCATRCWRVAGRDQVCPALYHASNHVLALQVQAGKKPASEMGNSSLCLQKLHVLTCAQYAHIKADVCVPAGTAADVLSHVLYQGPYGPLSGSAMMYVLGERSGQVSELHFEYTAATGLKISSKISPNLSPALSSQPKNSATLRRR